MSRKPVNKAPVKKGGKGSGQEYLTKEEIDELRVIS